MQWSRPSAQLRFNFSATFKRFPSYLPTTNLSLSRSNYSAESHSTVTNIASQHVYSTWRHWQLAARVGEPGLPTHTVPALKLTHTRTCIHARRLAARCRSIPQLAVYCSFVLWALSAPDFSKWVSPAPAHAGHRTILRVYCPRLLRVQTWFRIRYRWESRVGVISLGNLCKWVER